MGIQFSFLTAAPRRRVCGAVVGLGLVIVWPQSALAQVGTYNLLELADGAVIQATEDGPALTLRLEDDVVEVLKPGGEAPEVLFRCAPDAIRNELTVSDDLAEGVTFVTAGASGTAARSVAAVTEGGVNVSASSSSTPITPR